MIPADKELEGLISEGIFADLIALTEHERIPTKLEFDRFMRGHGFCPDDCKNCIYKIRYSPSPMYDSDFGRITGTQRPGGS